MGLSFLPVYSFVPQCYYGIHLGGTGGRIEAEDNADTYADKQGQHNA